MFHSISLSLFHSPIIFSYLQPFILSFYFSLSPSLLFSLPLLFHSVSSPSLPSFSHFSVHDLSFFHFSSFHSLFSLPPHPSLRLSLFPPLSYTLSHMQVKDAPVFRQTVLCEFCSSWPRRWRNSRNGFFRQSSREWPFVLQSWQNEFRLLGR